MYEQWRFGSVESMLGEPLLSFRLIGANVFDQPKEGGDGPVFGAFTRNVDLVGTVFAGQGPAVEADKFGQADPGVSSSITWEEGSSTCPRI